MGYQTSFCISKLQGSDEEYNQFLTKLKDRYDVDLDEECLIKWYDWMNNMTALSLEHPSLVLELSGEGEDQDDIWKCRFKAGEHELLYARIPPFRNRRVFTDEELKTGGARVGDMLLIIDMEDEPRYRGKFGIVQSIDSQNQLHGTWGGLAIQPERDSFFVVLSRM